MIQNPTSKPLNILLLNWRDVAHPKSGGAELVTMEHARRWVQEGHAVTWVTANYQGAKKDDNVEGVRFIRRMGSFSVYLYVPVYVLFNGNKFDIIVDEVHGFPFFSPLFTSTPVIVFIHEVAGEIWDYMFSFPKNIIGKMLERLYFRVYRSCQFWTIAPSTVKELVSHGIPRESCTAIPNSVVVRDSWVQNIKINHKEQNPTYIFVSRVVKMKGIEEVIKAFSFILKEQENAQLWIVGGGEEQYVEQLTEMMQEYGVFDRVKFWGKISDDKKFDLLSRAHVLLHASVKEGWGLVVLEAAYVHTPSVVYNVAGLCDVVKNGKTGVVLASNSPHEMAKEAVSLYIDKKRYAEFQKNGKQWVSSLKWNDITKQSLELLSKTITNHS